ncbi:hypothetical protein FJZ31_32475 [Candidatus Poribacteria bacterium]|nr:hypothetical protein [Candidatus Poribacteria bacterium]
MIQIVHRTFDGFIDAYAAQRGQGSKVKFLYFEEVAGKVPALDGLDAKKGIFFVVSFRTADAVHICYAATNNWRKRFALEVDWGILMSANGYSPLPGIAEGAWPISQDAMVET